MRLLSLALLPAPLAPCLILNWLWSYVFMGAVQRRMVGNASPIFTYHKIGPVPKRSRDPFLYVSPQQLDRQMCRLRTVGLEIVKLDEVVAAGALPARQAVITFDDGFRDVLENGLEVLARHRVPAIQYIVAGSMGKQNHWDVEKGDVPEWLMDVAQIKEWIAAGNQIGSHSLTHRNLKFLSQAEAREEIGASRKLLEDTFGVEVHHFSYPFGGWNPRVRDLVVEAGYRSATTATFGINAAGSDLFALRRIIPTSSRELVRKVIHRIGQKARKRR